MLTLGKAHQGGSGNAYVGSSFLVYGFLSVMLSLEREGSWRDGGGGGGVHPMLHDAPCTSQPLGGHGGLSQYLYVTGSK